MMLIEQHESIFVLSSVDQLLHLRVQFRGRRYGDDREPCLCLLTDRRKTSDDGNEAIREHDCNENERGKPVIE